MITYVVVINRLFGPNHRVSFATMEAAVQSAESFCAIFEATPKGADWRERITNGETIRTDKYTIRIDTMDFHTEAVESDKVMPTPLEEETYDPLVCYILVRTDLPDGKQSAKQLAHSHHAGVAMMARAFKGRDRKLKRELLEYVEEADGFGTALAMTTNYAQMLQTVSYAQIMGLFAGVVDDPTYPIRDGGEYKSLRVKTCAFVFGRKSKCAPIMKSFELYKVEGEN